MGKRFCQLNSLIILISLITFAPCQAMDIDPYEIDPDEYSELAENIEAEVEESEVLNEDEYFTYREESESSNAEEYTYFDSPEDDSEAF